MKWMLVTGALVLWSFAGTAEANVGVFAGMGHSIELASTGDIQMVSEDITITPGRGRFLFDGTVPGMDRVEYDCTFVLKNLKDQVVAIQAGFPLDAQSLSWPYDNSHKTSELVARYSFIAQEDERQYSVRYVPADREKTMRNVFLWNMSFSPGETKTLRVTYSMPISMTAMSTAAQYRSAPYDKAWYGALEGCLMEWFGYVTRTGQSWSGPIKKARFRVYVKEFERYVRQRRYFANASEADRTEVRRKFPQSSATVFRTTSPDGWKQDDEGYLTLTYADYEPEQDLELRYYLLFLPRTDEAGRWLMARLSPEGFTSEDRQDLVDIFREFNGTKTGNTRIAEFIKNQVWYGLKPLDEVPSEVIEGILAE